MAIPTARTWTDTTDATDVTMMSNLTDCVNFMHFRPGASVYRSTGLSISQNSITRVTYDTELYDYDNMFTGPTSRLVINTTGKYQVFATATYAPGTSKSYGSDLWIGVAKNSAGTFPGSASSNTIATDSKCYPLNGTQDIGGAQPQNHIDVLYPLTAGDYIEMWCWYDHGGTSSHGWIPGGDSTANEFYLAAHWVGA